MKTEALIVLVGLLVYSNGPSDVSASHLGTQPALGSTMVAVDHEATVRQTRIALEAAKKTREEASWTSRLNPLSGVNKAKRAAQSAHEHATNASNAAKTEANLKSLGTSMAGMRARFGETPARTSGLRSGSNGTGKFADGATKAAYAGHIINRLIKR
jgi:hypothetical protein